MSSVVDFNVGVGKETTYGTAVAPDRFFETEGKFKGGPETVKGAGFRPGKRVARLNRDTIARHSVSGDFTLEGTTKGLGFLLEAALGVVTNTAVAGATGVFQQVHTLRKDDPVNSYTIQEQLPLLGGGALQPITFPGCVAESLELSLAEGKPLSVKVAWTGQGTVDTATVAAAASYPTGDELLTFVGSKIFVGPGAVVPPTATSLATLASGTPNVNVRDVTVSVANNLDTEGRNLGGGGKRSRKNVLGVGVVTGKLTVEYDSNAARDAFLAQTQQRLLLTIEGAMIGTGTPVPAVLQVYLPAIKFKGELPTSNGGKAIVQSIDFEAFDLGTTVEPIYIVYRTTDATP